MLINLQAQQIYHKAETIINEKVITEAQEYQLHTVRQLASVATGMGVGIISCDEDTFELLFMTDYEEQGEEV